MLVETILDGGRHDRRNAEKSPVENEEHRHRMFLNVVSASFIILLMVTGYWVVTTLTGVV
jgi:hypothetical protein